MIITNVNNLPAQFVDLASIEYDYRPNEYRVTSLLRGLKETILLRRHHKEITIDVSSLVWMLFGTAVHDVLNRSQEAESELKEERIAIPVGDYLLSGQFDLYCSDAQTITDYKTTSVWKIIKGSYDDWFAQQCIYAILLEAIGFPVKHGRVVAFLKDHSTAELAKNPIDYPPLPVHTVNFDINPSDVKYFKTFINEQFKLINLYEQLADDDIPICEPHHRWIADWAVMKDGNTRATRVFKEEDEAWDWVNENIKEDDLSKIAVVSRGDRKCQGYCNVNKYCNYWRSTYESVSKNN